MFSVCEDTFVTEIDRYELDEAFEVKDALVLVAEEEGDVVVSVKLIELGKSVDEDEGDLDIDMIDAVEVLSEEDPLKPRDNKSGDPTTKNTMMITASAIMTESFCPVFTSLASFDYA